MNNDYLIHFGIKGMKWGVRKSDPRDATSVPIKKLRKQMVAEKTWTKSDAVDKKVIMKIGETPEAKASQKLSDLLTDLDKRVKTEKGPNSTFVLNKEDATFANEVFSKFQAKANQIIKDHKTEILSARLIDLGYDDTPAARAHMAKALMLDKKGI